MNSLQNARPWYSHRWPWFLMLGPALVLVAGAFTGYLGATRATELRSVAAEA